ncbi:rhodanese-like domain-containing protein [Bacillus sp. FJAT-49736]|uniref:rhodanese-like domain-containing protein n=1 Tax=Bacillus sp. FJAT-49736 TaxID=2833582 RepID=UPI001BCA4FCC|nr:rhodanese-like domain-containing protein [Bacillus sp. FJAT-49736]MBS4174363.1 rhodanese-like domain-containing protein [Bacillus sp. FJAT-49736]
MVIKKITPRELEGRMKGKPFVLDVRAADKFAEYHLENSHNLHKTAIFEEKDSALASLPKDKEIIVTCTTGNSAAKCAAILADKNYNVTLLEGGITAWKEYLREKGGNEHE